jgi:hypothetical protein
MAKRRINNISTLTAKLAAIAYEASRKAYNRAKKTNIPLVIEEDNKLYKVYPSSRKLLIKNIPKINRNLPSNFTLK